MPVDHTEKGIEQAIEDHDKSRKAALIDLGIALGPEIFEDARGPIVDIQEYLYGARRFARSCHELVASDRNDRLECVKYALNAATSWGKQGNVRGTPCSDRTKQRLQDLERTGRALARAVAVSFWLLHQPDIYKEVSAALNSLEVVIREAEVHLAEEERRISRADGQLAEDSSGDTSEEKQKKWRRESPPSRRSSAPKTAREENECRKACYRSRNGNYRRRQNESQGPAEEEQTLSGERPLSGH